MVTLLCPGESREGGPSALVSRDRASPFSVCFLALSIDKDGLSSGVDKPRGPYNATRPSANWVCLGAYSRFLFTGSGCHEWRFRRAGLAQWAWRRAQEAAKWNHNPPPKRGGKSAQEETRRGRAVAMRVLAAVRALWLCGT